MAGEENRKDERVPLAAKVQIKTAGLEKFIEKFSGNISRGGIFIKTPTPLPIGKEIAFSVVIPGGTQLLEAAGKVTWVRKVADPVSGEPAGMGIQFVTLGPGSEKVLEQVLAGGAEKGGAPPAAPAAPAAGTRGPEIDLSSLFDTDEKVVPPAAPAKPDAPPKPAAPVAPPPKPAGNVPAKPAAPAAGPSIGLAGLMDDIEESLSEGTAPDAPAPATARPQSPAAAARAAPATAAPQAQSAILDDIEAAFDDAPFVNDDGMFEHPEGLDPTPAIEPATTRAPKPAPAAAKPAPPEPSAEAVRPGDLPASDVVLGIDLGTTYSCAAFLKEGVPEVLALDAGYRTTPSVVTLLPNEQIVGRAAYDRIATHPKNTIYGSKRLLGRKYISRAVQDAKKYFDYEIVSDENGHAAVKIDGEIFPLVMVTSRILEEIRTWARTHFKADVNQALICVPAYYNDTQRNAVIEAAQLAGFEVRRIVNEPVAAALAYGYEKGLNQRLLVYDLGGGTFDVSVMELNGNVFDVIAAGGDPYLGGVDFDNRLVDLMAAAFKHQTGVDIYQDKIAILRLRAAAETAKRDLSEKTEVRVQLPYLARTGEAVASLDMLLRRSDVEKWVQDLVERTVGICGEVLAAAGLERSQIDAVLLVGGQTRMPLIQNALTQFFGKPPRKGVHPDEAVAMGAALLAGSLDRVDSVVLLDVVSMSIGIGLPGGVFRRVLQRNSKLPASGATTVATTKDAQTQVTIDIFQGDFQELSRNDYLGTIELDGFPARPAGEASFDIVFRMDAQGFLMVSATDRLTGMTQQVTLRTRDTPEALASALDS